MRRKTTASMIIACFLALVFLWNVSVFAVADTAPGFYSSIMNSEKWKTSDYLEKIELCKIPDDVLAGMRTSEIVKATVEFPFIIDLTLFNSYEEGYAHVLACSSALQELERREDGFLELIEYYNKMPIEQSMEPLEIIQVLLVEILISNFPLAETYGCEQMKQIEMVVREKQESKQRFPEVFGTSNVLSISIMSQSQNNSEFTYHTVNTLKGVSVSVIHYLSDLTVAQKNAENIAFSQAYPNATILGTATTNYNCASYAMINRSVSNIYWLNNLSPSNAGYTLLGSSLSYAAAGRIVYYVRTDSLGSHVGVVQRITNGTIWVRSKMGLGPLAEHKIQDCAYYPGNAGLRFYY